MYPNYEKNHSADHLGSKIGEIESVDAEKVSNLLSKKFPYGNGKGYVVAL